MLKRFFQAKGFSKFKKKTAQINTLIFSFKNFRRNIYDQTYIIWRKKTKRIYKKNNVFPICDLSISYIYVYMHHDYTYAFFRKIYKYN